MKAAVIGAGLMGTEIALVFALAKRLPSVVRYQAQKVWGQELLWNEKPRPREIAGATLGLVGLGLRRRRR